MAGHSNGHLRTKINAKTSSSLPVPALGAVPVHWDNSVAPNFANTAPNI
jgi:hypothetical protein